eukprot:s2760_g8.t1
MCAQASEAYEAVGLATNPKKAFSNQTCSRFWGLEIDGEKGILRPSSLRLWPICLITLRVATLGLSTVSLLDALAGSWVSLLGLRRKLYSMLNLIFEPLGISDQKKILRLSPELVDELVSLVIIGTLGCVNLRACFYDQVVATDASENWMAGVTAFCPERVVAEVSRFSLRKGVWTKLLTPTAAWEKSHGMLDETEELPGDAYKAHPLWTLLATSLEFSESWREQVRRPTHINILELRSHLRHEKRIAARNVSKRERPDFSQPGGLDLFGGHKGVAKQMVKYGCPWVLTFDYVHSVSENLLGPKLRTCIEEMIECACFLTLGMLCAKKCAMVTVTQIGWQICFQDVSAEVCCFGLKIQTLLGGGGRGSGGDIALQQVRVSLDVASAVLAPCGGKPPALLPTLL